MVPAIPYGCKFGSQLQHFQSSSLLVYLSMPQVLGPLAHLGDPEEAPSSWLLKEEREELGYVCKFLEISTAVEAYLCSCTGGCVNNSYF